MVRVWPLLVLAAILGGEPTPAFAQLKVAEKATVPLPKASASDSLAALTPDGRTVAVTDGDDGKVYSVLLLDAGTGKEQATLRAHALKITCLTFDSDGTLLATGGSDGTIKVWDLKTRNQLAVLRGYLEPRALAFSPDGKTLATVGASERVLGRKSAESDNLDHGVIRLWDVGTGKERANLSCYAPSLFSSADKLGWLRYSPDGKRLWAGDHNGPNYLWDMDAERLVSDRFGGYASVFSPDSKLLVNSFENKLVFRDGATGKEKKTVEVQGAPLAFSPKGNMLAVWTKNGIELVNVETGKSVATLKAVSTDAPHVVFSPDGKTLTALMRTDKEAAIKVWELAWEKAPAK